MGTSAGCVPPRESLSLDRPLILEANTKDLLGDTTRQTTGSEPRPDAVTTLGSGVWVWTGTACTLQDLLPRLTKFLATPQ